MRERLALVRRVAIVTDDFGVHAKFTHAPGDQLRILRAEIENENSLAVDISAQDCGSPQPVR